MENIWEKTWLTVAKVNLSQTNFQVCFFQCNRRINTCDNTNSQENCKKKSWSREKTHPRLCPCQLANSEVSRLKSGGPLHKIVTQEKSYVNIIVLLMFSEIRLRSLSFDLQCSIHIRCKKSSYCYDDSAFFPSHLKIDMLVFINRCFLAGPRKKLKSSRNQGPENKITPPFQVILTNAVLSTLAKSALFVQVLWNCWSTMRRHLFWYSYLNFKSVGQPGSFVSDAGVQNNKGLSQGNTLTLEVWDQASRTVARMIHKKGFRTTKGQNVIFGLPGYIYDKYISYIYIYPFEPFPLGIICTEGCLSKFMIHALSTYGCILHQLGPPPDMVHSNHRRPWGCRNVIIDHHRPKVYTLYFYHKMLTTLDPSKMTSNRSFSATQDNQDDMFNRSHIFHSHPPGNDHISPSKGRCEDDFRPP